MRLSTVEGTVPSRTLNTFIFFLNLMSQFESSCVAVCKRHEKNDLVRHAVTAGSSLEDISLKLWSSNRPNKEAPRPTMVQNKYTIQANFFDYNLYSPHQRVHSGAVLLELQGETAVGERRKARTISYAQNISTASHVPNQNLPGHIYLLVSCTCRRPCKACFPVARLSRAPRFHRQRHRLSLFRMISPQKLPPLPLKGG